MHLWVTYNSGGGKLTIWLTKICSASEIEKCVKIIQDAAENILSNTKRADCVMKKSMNRLLLFSVRGSEEIVTMKYNMYVMEDDEVKLVSSTRSAADVRRVLQKRRGESVPVAKGYNQRKIIEYQTRLKEEPIPRTKRFGRRKKRKNRARIKEAPDPKTKEFGHGKNVEDRARSKEEPVPRTKEFDHEAFAKVQTRTVKVSGIFTVKNKLSRRHCNFVSPMQGPTLSCRFLGIRLPVISHFHKLSRNYLGKLAKDIFKLLLN